MCTRSTALKLLSLSGGGNGVSAASVASQKETPVIGSLRVQTGVRSKIILLQVKEQTGEIISSELKILNNLY